MAQPTLLPDPTCLHLQLLDASDHAITARVTSTSEDAECPLCHQRSARIHSRYARDVADLSWIDCAVRLELHVRRFFCPNPECARQIFTERLPTVVAPYARRTTRLADVFTLIAFALGGEAGKKRAEGMKLSTSPDTLLRLIRRKPSRLKATAQIQPASATSAEEAAPALPWYTGQSKRQEEKSQQYHQERVEHYHKIHDLAAKQVDVANIARQVGLSRQGVYNYLRMKQPPERTRIHQPVGQTLSHIKST